MPSQHHGLSCLDSTSLSSYGKLIDLLEQRYDQDGKNLSQINLGIVIRIPDGIPISYHIYPGSNVGVCILSTIIVFKANRLS